MLSAIEEFGAFKDSHSRDMTDEEQRQQPTFSSTGYLPQGFAKIYEFNNEDLAKFLLLEENLRNSFDAYHKELKKEKFKKLQ